MTREGDVVQRRGRLIVFKFTHNVILDGEDAYVEERQEGLDGFTRFGPMPRDAVGPFIDERREWLADTIHQTKLDH
jgi:hypothetical protein